MHIAGIIMHSKVIHSAILQRSRSFSLIEWIYCILVQSINPFIYLHSIRAHYSRLLLGHLYVARVTQLHGNLLPPLSCQTVRWQPRNIEQTRSQRSQVFGTALPGKSREEVENNMSAKEQREASVLLVNLSVDNTGNGTWERKYEVGRWRIWALSKGKMGWGGKNREKNKYRMLNFFGRYVPSWI